MLGVLSLKSRQNVNENLFTTEKIIFARKFINCPEIHSSNYSRSSKITAWYVKHLDSHHTLCSRSSCIIFFDLLSTECHSKIFPCKLSRKMKKDSFSLHSKNIEKHFSIFTQYFFREYFYELAEEIFNFFSKV